MTERYQGMVQGITPVLRPAFALHGAHVYNNTGLTIANTTDTVLTFNTETWDDADYHSTSSNTGRLTIPADGRYVFGCGVRFAANGTGVRECQIRVNGTDLLVFDTQAGNAGHAAAFVLASIEQFDAGDYLEILVYQSSGGNLSVERNAAYSPIAWIWRLS